MLKVATLIFTSIILFSNFGCDKKIAKPEPGLNELFGFNPIEYETNLKAVFTFADTNTFLFKSIKENLDTIKYYYSSNKFNPVFVKSFESKGFIDSLLNIIESVKEHGLNPEMYHYNAIKSEFYESIKTENKEANRYVHLANAELLTANAILNYSTDMRHGVVNPRKIFDDSYFLPVTDSLNRQLFEPLKQNDIIQYLYNIQPKSDKYKKLQAALKRFESIEQIEWTTIPVIEKKIEIGDSFSFLNLITKRLTVLGFLDTNRIKLKDINSYDSIFIEPIKSFQRANGLIDDGVIGKTTIERLNLSPKDYINKIKLTLERFRWLDYSDTAKYVLVNIPDFRLYAVENGKEKFNIVVCSGRKGKWETPNLYGEISYLVLNPTWSVPRSIIEEEIVSGLRKDSLYLKKRNFRVYKSGERVSLDGLKALDLSSSKRYTLVQDPGAGNALGKIKFMFKNPFGVYLHDTPTRAPFKYINRAVSHGCIRVEKPMQLADYLLANNSLWTLDYLKIEIGQKVDDQKIISEFNEKRSELRKNSSYGVTTEVKFDNVIPLFVDYYTIWVDQNGMLNIRDDVYGRDKILMKFFSEKQ